MYGDNYSEAPFEELKGKTITEMEGAEEGSESIIITCADGTKFRLMYHQDCCANCSVEEIIGDVKDLIGSPILLAEEISSREPDAKIIAERKANYEKAKAEWQPRNKDDEFWYWGPSESNGWLDESETWCFYKLSTIKGSVTLRWYGSSNGYYSESATFEKERVGA